MDVTYDPAFELIHVDGQPVSALFLKMLMTAPDGTLLKIRKQNGMMVLEDMNCDSDTESSPCIEMKKTVR
jgi:hypothetical protein